MPAFKRLAAGGREYIQFSTTETYCLREASSGSVGSFLITLKKNGGGTFSLTVKGVAAGYGLAYADAFGLPYQKMSDAVVDKAAGTAITTEDNYVVQSDGMDVWLDLTAISAGTLDVYFQPLLG